MNNKTVWLLERRSLSADGKVVYASKHGGSTTLPFDALRFKTRQEARDNIQSFRIFPQDWLAVEHSFVFGYLHRRTLRGFIIHWSNRLSGGNYEQQNSLAR